MDSEVDRIIEQRKKVILQLKRVLIDNLHLELHENEMSEDSALFGIELALDSIDALQFVVGVETEFGVSLPTDDMLIFRSINSVADYLIEHDLTAQG